MAKTSVPCESCRRPVFRGDEFCEACGGVVGDATKRAIVEAIREKRERRDDELAREQIAAQKRELDLRRATKWLGWLGVMFVISAVLMAGIEWGRVEQGQAGTMGLEEPSNGPILILVSNVLLGAIMLGCQRWAKRAPLPALATAAGVFFAVQVLSAIVEPASILSGIIVKIFATIALVAGLKAALAEHQATRPQLSPG